MKLSTVFLSITLFSSFYSGNALAQSNIEENKNNEYSFACYRNPETGLPTTFIIRDGDPQGEGIPIIQWRSNYFKGYPSEARCKIVSERMQKLRSSLVLITNSWLNGEPVICAAADRSSRESRCSNSRLLFTLESSDDADKFLRDIESLFMGSGTPITSQLLPSQGGKFYVDMKRLVKFGKAVKMGDRL